MLFGILLFYSVSALVITATTIRVVKRDWILASLMLFPLPVVGGWMITRDKAIGLASGSSVALHSLDMRMAWALVTLGLSTIIFLRLKHRSHKLGALVVAALLAFTMVWHTIGTTFKPTFSSDYRNSLGFLLSGACCCRAYCGTWRGRAARR